ncbi:MAG: biotin--[acetyl-CoA-carboxylase] ligase [Planctomycetes bacterium]|nr:biotin--[acetyl-CoA-carboxylase] ligase [Planctomycetota bacterium]
MANSENEKPLSSFSEADLHRLQQETLVQQVEFHHSLDSTNDRALQLATEVSKNLPLLVLAEAQTAGRGRGTNRWWTAGGALTFSLLIEAEAAQLPPTHWPLMSLTAGLAICEVCQNLLPKADVRLKWPNDVFVNNRKVSGILIEAPPTKQAKLVIGIGINVNNSLADAPPEVAETATSLCDVAHRQFSLPEVLLATLTQLEKRFAWLGLRDAELCDLWQKRCLLTGRQVKIEIATNSVVGTCQGIDSTGALVVKTDKGTQRCLSGTVTLL